MVQPSRCRALLHAQSIPCEGTLHQQQQQWQWQQQQQQQQQPSLWQYSTLPVAKKNHLIVISSRRIVVGIEVEEEEEEQEQEQQHEKEQEHDSMSQSSSSSSQQ